MGTKKKKKKRATPYPNMKEFFPSGPYFYRGFDLLAGPPQNGPDLLEAVICFSSRLVLLHSLSCSFVLLWFCVVFFLFVYCFLAVVFCLHF